MLSLFSLKSVGGKEKEPSYVCIEFLLMTQNRKLLISSSKMRNYLRKKCEQSLYVNPKLSP